MNILKLVEVVVVVLLVVAIRCFETCLRIVDCELAIADRLSAAQTILSSHEISKQVAFRYW